MLVAPRIAGAVGVAEGTARPIDESLADWLRDKRLLLVLDNFEQVVAAAPIVADLLRGGARDQGRRHQPGRRCTSRASRSTRSRACPRRPTRAS